MRLRVLVCSWLLLLAVAAASSAAVDDYIGKPVGAVRLLVEGRDTVDPSMAAVVETQVGQPLSMAQVRETIAHLFSLQRFESVSVDAALDGGRVTLRYELAPIHPVTAITFAGSMKAPGIDEGALRRALADRFGTTPSAGRLSEMVRVVSDALADRGYFHAAVTPTPRTFHAPEHATITLTIEPGVRTAIGDIQVEGTPSVGSAELLRRLRITPGVPYQRELLNARIQEYIADRRAHGYYQAKLTPAVDLRDGDRTAALRLTVDSGPHVRVVWAGNDVPSSMRADLVPVEREGSVDEDLLEDSTARIEDYLRNLGYRDAAAPHTRQPAESELIITFRVTKGREYRVATVEIAGNASISSAEFAPALKVREGQPFSEARLDSDRIAIEDFYHRRGFAGAHVDAAGDPAPTANPAAQVPVNVRLVVTEGVRTTVDSIEFTGNRALDAATLRSAAALKPGDPLVPGRIAIDGDAIQTAYQDRGYENATVQVRTAFAADRTRVAVTFDIQEGPQVFVDHVLISGNVRTSTSTIERALDIQAGAPLSVAKVNESQQKLLSLGLFRRVRINELSHGDETRRDVLVNVEESPPTTIGFGGGLEGRLIESQNDQGVASTSFVVAPRASFEVGRRNLFGKNRAVNLFAGVSQPFSASNDTQNLHEYRVVGTFREPRLFNTSADALLNATAEQQIRSSFTYARQSLSGDIARKVTRAVSVTFGYQVQRTELVSSNVEADPEAAAIIKQLFTLQPLRLASFSTSVVHDTRDDQVNPRSGQYFSGSGQLTARAIGSQIGFAKTIVTAQTFRELPGTAGTVFAANARVGLAAQFDEANPVPEPERFFAGGDTNRGFALDTLGVRHDVYDQNVDTIDDKGFAIGGNATVILNGELRVPVLAGRFPNKFSVVGFVDAGNVFLRASQVDLADLRTAVGFGVRYQSPFGPFRLDLGFKTRVASFLCPTPDDAAHQCVESRPALHISFGQAF
ncbi:MAG TPA: POTRA domain-containing protein [Vicinamibacterales bacterium]|nr:POTRA domain-containing protein [Vicinamibacterales bacterium]